MNTETLKTSEFRLTSVFGVLLLVYGLLLDFAGAVFGVSFLSIGYSLSRGFFKWHRAEGKISGSKSTECHAVVVSGVLGLLATAFGSVSPLVGLSLVGAVVGVYSAVRGYVKKVPPKFSKVQISV